MSIYRTHLHSMQAYRNCIFCQKLHIDYAHLLLCVSVRVCVARWKNARMRVFNLENETCPVDMRFQRQCSIYIGNHWKSLRISTLG